MTPKQLQQILRLSKARLKLEEARLALASAKLGAVEDAMHAARRTAAGAGSIDAPPAAEALYRASLSRLRDGRVESESLKEERRVQAEIVKREIRRKLMIDAALRK